jgi:hypothetical protein
MEMTSAGCFSASAGDRVYELGQGTFDLAKNEGLDNASFNRKDYKSQ